MNNNDIIKAIKNVTDIQPKKQNKFACVHFFHEIPNSKEGWNFIKGIRNFINKDRYKVRVLGRGSRKKYGTQSFIPLKHATNYSVYIDHKIMDRNHPDFLSRKFFDVRMAKTKIETSLFELNNVLNEPNGE